MNSRRLAIVSVTGFVVAVAATVFAHVGLGPGYDPTSLTLSDYALFDHGVALVLAMVALSGGTLALLGGMVAERVPVRGWPTALLLVWALGLLVSAAVPTDPPGMAQMSPAALVHRYASVAAFVALPAAVLVLAARLRRTEVVPWMSLVTLLRRLVAASAVGIAALWYAAFPGERVMMGLVERGLVAVEVLILFALAMRLLRVTAPAIRGAALGQASGARPSAFRSPEYAYAIRWPPSSFGRVGLRFTTAEVAERAADTAVADGNGLAGPSV